MSTTYITINIEGTVISIKTNYHRRWSGPLPPSRIVGDVASGCDTNGNGNGNMAIELEEDRCGEKSGGGYGFRWIGDGDGGQWPQKWMVCAVLVVNGGLHSQGLRGFDFGRFLDLISNWYEF